MNTTKPQKDIVIFVMAIPPGTIEQLKALENDLGYAIKPLLLLDSRVKKPPQSDEGVIEVRTDFSKPEKIAEALLPYKTQLLAITCRSEKNLARFAAVLPHVPYLRTPTVDSLTWSADKLKMRRRFAMYDKSITPKFTVLEHNSKDERAKAAKRVGFPMVIKPTNLAASLFVSICYHEEELEKTLRSVFRRLRKAYENDNRLETPQVIAEEYMDGDLYSIDSYVDSRGKTHHCPLVKQVSAKQRGHDDFYNYLQITPTTFKTSTIERAQETATTAIHALGLRSCLVHSELMKIDDEWKVVEVGARMGGFRHKLYEMSCDINHTANDVRIRIPKKPVIPKKCKNHACAIKWFADSEGVIKEMKGIKRIEQLESFVSINVHKRIGDKAVFARNGGRSIFTVFLCNADRPALLADIRRIEKTIDIKVGK
jgi:biotin carboxylase